MGGQLDVHEAQEFPIILGESLKDGSRTRSQHVQVRYNWEPSGGFNKFKGSLKQDDDGFKLSYHKDGTAAPASTFRGFKSGRVKDKDHKDSSRFVLVLDESRSAFVLEKISTSIDLNVTSALELTKDEIRKQSQIHRSASEEAINGNSRASSDKDEEGDPTNPFDFRHFLSEARESMEKPAQQSESRTPIPGGNTPIGRISSPSIGTGRFANTATFTTTTTSTASAAKKATTSQPVSKAKPARKVPPKRKEPVSTRTAQPLSKERIDDSDDELSDTASVDPVPSKSHTRNISSASNASRSNNIVFSGGGLEIDGGSPPQEPRRKYKIDPEAFRSQTQTPVLSSSSHRRSPPRTHNEDIIMRDAGQSEYGDSDDDHEDGEDGDVERLELDEERPKRDYLDQPRPVDTPPAATNDDEDDDDDALAMELMNALEEEGSVEGDRPMNAYGHVNDDESEISEEE